MKDINNHGTNNAFSNLGHSRAATIQEEPTKMRATASALSLVASLFTVSSACAAAIYTDYSNFVADLPGLATTLNFDSDAAGTTIASGTSLGGITFTYDFGGVQLAVTDGDQFGGGGPFDTTSPANFLGTDDADLLQDGDDFSMSFGAVNAIGMYFISADEMFDGDITLSAGGMSAQLVAADLQQTLSDGGKVFFLGIIDDANAFTSASVTTIGGGFFLYNVDDITMAVTEPTPNPEPNILALVGIGMMGLWASRRRRA